ncbi:2-oxoisovalerate dehydrogenase subunit alpha 1, mitochondrial [Glycine max]|nr:2-oxoisovalerate dehydrogenase subunit alpha 1, mitochondrial [Glycine max]
MDDVVFPQQIWLHAQYREAGVLLWRGFTLQEFANQLFSNKYDNGKGRQIPAHYGSKKHNYFTVASTIALSIEIFYIQGFDGDFHAALNFAAVSEAPVIFICRNNGWAISTPISDQFRSDGVVMKGQAYGVRSIGDGNDAPAIYSAIQAARQMAITEERPILIEALTFRVGHHTTSDDSTKYRPANEIEWWRLTRDPVARFRKWIEKNGWWNDMAESQLINNLRQQARYTSLNPLIDDNWIPF